MARSSLSNIPSAALEAVLHPLAYHDYGKLRQVSRSVRDSITSYVPYIIMRLSESSRAEHLQQWCQLTRQLQHAENIHILLTGKVTADMFELAMQLLSQRFNNITELHLLAFNHHSSSSSSSSSSEDPGLGPVTTDTACIASLLPLKHLLNSLKTLVLYGVLVQDLADDLQQLGAAATAAGQGWQLQNLTLRADWTDTIERNYTTGEEHASSVLWSCFSDAMMQITKAFPHLQQLTVQMPFIGLQQIVTAAANHHEDAGSEDSDIGGGAPYIRSANTLHILQDDNMHIDYKDSSIKSHAATAQVAAAAALANAALQLQHLQQLTVAELPDLWQTRKQFLCDHDAGTVPKRLSAVAIAKARTKTAAAAAAVDALYDVGLPLTTSAAAAAFGTLDDCGCWLLQKHDALKKVHTVTIGQSFNTMSWRRREPCCCEKDSSCSDTADASTAAELLDLHVSMDWSRRQSVRRRRQSFDSSDSSSSSSSDDDGFYGLLLDEDEDDVLDDDSLTSHLSHQLSLYSFRPASSLMCNISSCSLVIDEGNVGDLADLLGGMKSLRHLAISVPRSVSSAWDSQAESLLSDSEELPAAVSATEAAMAATRGLDSLYIQAYGCDVHVAVDLLLLLLRSTAGGLCNSLTKLDLTALPSAQAEQVCYSSGSANRLQVDMKWSLALKQLKNLRYLCIYEMSSDIPHRFSVDCLPASLEVFTAYQLNIYSAAVAAGNAACDVAQCMAVAGAHGYPALQQLCLSKCELSDPSILASDQLQQLTLLDSGWSGGWATAAAAWPNVRKLALNYEVQFSSHKDGSGEVEEAATGQPSILNDAYAAHHMLQEIAVGFKQLSYLSLERLPCMRVEVFAKFVLQPVVQQMQNIRYLHIMSACMTPHELDELCAALQGLEGEAAAAVMTLLSNDGSSSSSSSNSSLRSISGDTVQQWLQEQLPWASIAVSNAKPMPVWLSAPLSP